MQEQPVDDLTNEVFGAIVEPKTISIQGSQQIPYINDNLGTNEDWLNAYLKMYNMSWDERKDLGQRAAESVRRRYPMSGENGMVTKWEKAFEKYINLYKQNNPTRVKIAKV